MSDQSLDDIAAGVGPIVDRSPLPTVATEGETQIVRYANPAFVRFAGRSLETVLGHPLADCLPEPQRKNAIALLDGVYQSGVAGQAMDLGPARAGQGNTHDTYSAWPLRRDENQSTILIVQIVDTTNQVRTRDGATDTSTELREVNQRILVAGLAAHEQVDTQTALNSSLREVVGALRLSEHRFRALAETVPLLVWFTRSDGWVEYFNPRWHEYTGLSPEETLGTGWRRVVHPDDRASTLEKWAHGLATGESVEIECRLLRHDGAYRWFLVRASALRDETGTIERWFGTCTDIQEQREAVRARDEFLSIAAHELRTPVTAIKGTAQLGLRSYGRGTLNLVAAEKALQTIDRVTDRLAVLMSDLLDVSRIRGGQLSLRRERLDINELVNAMVGRTAEWLAESHLMVAELPAQPVWVDGDIGRLEQVFENLLSNAVKYSPAGGTVEVMLTTDEDGAEVAVKDTGIGLPEGTSERIFEPFGRVANAVYRDLPGIGLGLYISRRIVELHGGRVWAESPGEGLGTTMRVWLPQNRDANWHDPHAAPDFHSYGHI